MMILLLLMGVPYSIMMIVSYKTQDTMVSKVYSAETLLKDRVSEIDVAQVVKSDGSVDIITDELKVEHLGGEVTLPQTEFTQSEFTQFLLEINRSNSKYHRSIAYSSQGEYWLVVTFPVSLKMEFVLQYNEASQDFPFYYKVVVIALSCYIILVVLSAFLLSKYQAKILVHMEEGRKQLVRDIAHDLKNPLASIQGNAEMICTYKDATPKQKEYYANIIYRNSVRANELLSILFEYSKIDSADFTLHLSREDICELLRLRVAPFLSAFEKKGIEVEVQIPEEECFVRMDHEQMNRVFDNLLDNILKYGKGATKLSITLEQQRKWIMITVEDNGEGMDEETRKHCFDAFYREDSSRNSQAGGNGLGLAIVYKIIQAHHGKIEVESAKGKGCKFSIRMKKM